MRLTLGCVAYGAIALLGGTTRAETVNVKYLGEVDLAPFTCHSIDASSLIERICYERKTSHMLIRMKPATWYQYCGVPSPIVEAFHAAGSKGGYFNNAIKGRFSCREVSAPANSRPEERP